DYLASEAASRLNRQPVRLSRRLTSFLGCYEYPGNIRELRNIIFRISCLAAEIADVEHLPENVRARIPERMAQPEPEAVTSLNDAKRRASDAAERSYLRECLQQANFSVTALARNIGMNRSHVQTLLKKHGINVRRAVKPNAAAAARLI
ncbi:MAG: sigma-54-dependent Fis family transcriptional regulator, partial [Pseudomonadota bacterium]|nr:sigma-54-dependent Fis family transcriptional regulator [Pseudomonadota bacterium]